VGNKSVKTGSKIRFLNALETFPPSPSTFSAKMILLLLSSSSILSSSLLLFIRPYRLQRLHNIELEAKGNGKLTLHAKKLNKWFKIEKPSFSKLKVFPVLLLPIVHVDMSRDPVDLVKIQITSLEFVSHYACIKKR